MTGFFGWGKELVGLENSQGNLKIGCLNVTVVMYLKKSVLSRTSKDKNLVLQKLVEEA